MSLLQQAGGGLASSHPQALVRSLALLLLQVGGLAGCSAEAAASVTGGLRKSAAFESRRMLPAALRTEPMRAHDHDGRGHSPCATAFKAAMSAATIAAASNIDRHRHIRFRLQAGFSQTADRESIGKQGRSDLAELIAPPPHTHTPTPTLFLLARGQSEPGA